jgi:NADPH-dependent 2,4-dienoyl-CoA reductase/sulfur reductase-like enzyme
MDQQTIHFSWNGRAIGARSGDSVAAALYRVGIISIAATRKTHEPMGYSGSFIGGVLARVDGRPNVRLDQEVVKRGMRVESQNHWPNASFDLLKLARFIPPKWVYGGFEHGRFTPTSGKAYLLWERLLATLAGIAEPPSPSAISGERKATKVVVDTLVIGGGPAGQSAANRAAAEGKIIALVTRGDRLGRCAAAMGTDPIALDDKVRVFTGVELFGSYRGGRLLVGAPVRHDQGAVAFEVKRVVLAIGKESMPPMVYGNHLPGVMDARTALMLAHAYDILPGKQIAVVGSGAEKAIAARLRTLGANVVFSGSVDALSHIHGSLRVGAIDAGRRIACDALVHAGPWRRDPSLDVQSRAEGRLQVSDVMIDVDVEFSGFAAQSDETIRLPRELNPRTRICPCMDVTAGELSSLISDGEVDPEVLKRRTSCGMGPCQGLPCWESMLALLANLTNRMVDEFVLPSHRAPRRSITVAQAAGLCDVVDPL